MREGERRERNYLKVHIITCTVLVIMYVNHEVNGLPYNQLLAVLILYSSYVMGELQQKSHYS